MNHCSAKCDKYSDFDVYYTDGSTDELCADHLRETNMSLVAHVIPQHGSDILNVPIQKPAYVPKPGHGPYSWESWRGKRPSPTAVKFQEIISNNLEEYRKEENFRIERTYRGNS